MMNNKVLFLLAFCVMTVFSLSACGSKEMNMTETEKPSVTAQTESVSSIEAATATSIETTNMTTEPTTESSLTGWNFDSKTGTLSLYEQRFLDKTPYTGNRKNVKTVELSGSVTTITPSKDQDSGLSIYPNLKKVVCGNSVRVLERVAFDRCENIEHIVLGSGVQEIGEDAFFGSDYGSGSFACAGLKKIEVDKNNPYFTTEDNVLYNKDRTELILYPISRQGTEFVIPDRVRKVRWLAFVNNQTLRKLTVGKGIQSIDFGIIGCENLKELVLPDTVHSIKDSAIKMCGLQSAVIPDSVTTVGSEAFAFCDDLRTIHIGKGLMYTDTTLWCNSPVLTDITIDAENPSLCLVDGVVFSKDRKTLLLYPGGYTQEEYRIPDGTENIGWSAFLDEGHLKRIYVPKSIKNIDPDNFISMNYVNEQFLGYEYPYEILVRRKPKAME